MKPFKKILLGIIGAFILMGVVSRAPTVSKRHLSEQHAITEILNLEVASRLYQKTYKTLPEGDHLEIIQQLSGRNPNEKIFLQFEEDQINAAGTFVDPWGTPYRFQNQSSHTLTVTSAGKDKRFGTEDDLTSDRP